MLLGLCVASLGFPLFVSLNARYVANYGVFGMVCGKKFIIYYVSCCIYIGRKSDQVIKCPPRNKIS